jgi:hypothetical protein
VHTEDAPFVEEVRQIHLVRFQGARGHGAFPRNRT